MVPSNFYNDSNATVEVVIHQQLGKAPFTMLYQPQSVVTPIDLQGEVIVAIDPSKTCTAVVIGNTEGQVLRIVEVKGGGSQLTVADFATLLTQFLSQYLQGVRVAMFAQEKVIMAGGKGKSYRSMVYLNEIRTALNNYSRTYLRMDSNEILVSAWKAAILPKGFNKRGEKGSKKFLEAVNPVFYYYDDDITDAICIFLYVHKKYFKEAAPYCNLSEDARYTFDYALVDPTEDVSGALRFKYNNAFSFNDNLNFFVNRREVVGVVEIPQDVVTPKLLYSTACILNYTTQRLCALVSRKR